MLKPIDEGWQSLRAAVVPGDAPEAQIQEMRTCFYAGAHHLFHYIMQVMEPGTEATDKDLDVMAAIHNELTAFRAVLVMQAAIQGKKPNG